MLWREEDWSWEYSLNTFAWKLNRLKDQMQTGCFISVNADKYAKDIDICINLIARLNENDYSSKLSIEIYDKMHPNGWEFIQSDTHINLLELKEEEISPSLHRVYMSEIEKAERRRQSEYDLLFKILHKKMQYWWD